METRIVRYGDLKPCRTAFIDAHTPGSDQKENFTIIGGGVSESPDQHVHIKDTPGFNIGAAGQPPKMPQLAAFAYDRGSLLCPEGQMAVFLGALGNRRRSGSRGRRHFSIFRPASSVALKTSAPTTDMIMAILGGDDAGGGVTWAPQVIEDASDHGLVLGQNGVLYDNKKGQALPDGVSPMPLLSDEELKAFPEPGNDAVVKDYVARYWDMMALGAKSPCRVIGRAGPVERQAWLRSRFPHAGIVARDELQPQNP